MRDTHGNILRSFGSRGSGKGQFNDIRCITFDFAGNAIIADKSNHRICAVKQDGSFICEFGKLGKAEGQLSGPYAVCFDQQGRIWVGDFSTRVQVFGFAENDNNNNSDGEGEQQDDESVDADKEADEKEKESKDTDKGEDKKEDKSEEKGEEEEDAALSDLLAAPALLGPTLIEEEVILMTHKGYAEAEARLRAFLRLSGSDY